MEACDAKGSKSRRNPVPQIPIGTFAHQIRIRRDPIVVSTSDGSGQFFGKISVEAHVFSKSAVEKIQAAGGTATVIGATAS
jgi:ribosomal protein L18E